MKGDNLGISAKLLYNLVSHHCVHRFIASLPSAFECPFVTLKSCAWSLIDRTLRCKTNIAINYWKSFMALQLDNNLFEDMQVTSFYICISH